MEKRSTRNLKKKKKIRNETRSVFCCLQCLADRSNVYDFKNANTMSQLGRLFYLIEMGYHFVESE